MGQKISSVFRRNRYSNSQIGLNTPCPCCGMYFPRSTTYIAFNEHIDGCLQGRDSVEVISSRQRNASERHQKDRFDLSTDSTTNSDLEYFWAKVPYQIEGDGETKYKWEKRAYSKKELNPLSIRNMKPEEVKQLPFEKKQFWLKEQCEKLRIPWTQGADWIRIHTDNVLMNSLHGLLKCNLHKEVKIEILGDKVNDAGGLLREWMLMCMKEILHPNTGMFVTAETADVSYKINREADHDEHLIDCFKLLGKIIGKAIFDRITIDAFLDRSVVNYIIGKTNSLEDMSFYDKDLYKSWKFLMNNQLQEDDFIDIFAVYVNSPDGKYTQVVELIPGGEQIIVNNDNKGLYIEKKMEYLCVGAVKIFLDAMCKEIYKVVPKDQLQVFQAHELEMLLIGVPFIDLQDWKIHTEYNGYSNTSTTIIYFWKVLAEFSQQELAKFLQYCTGSSRTPVNGFMKLESNRGNYSKFNIKKVDFSKLNEFPKAHTCFNRLELPDYPSINVLRLRLKAVIDNDFDGVFGLS